MSRSKRRPRRKGLSTLGYLGLIVGLAAATYATAQSGAGSTPAPSQPPSQTQPPPASPKPPKPFSPTERINVEQAVDFPYDI